MFFEISGIYFYPYSIDLFAHRNFDTMLISKLSPNELKLLFCSKYRSVRIAHIKPFFSHGRWGVKVRQRERDKAKLGALWHRLKRSLGVGVRVSGSYGHHSYDLIHYSLLLFWCHLLKGRFCK